MSREGVEENKTSRILIVLLVSMLTVKPQCHSLGKGGTYYNDIMHFKSSGEVSFKYTVQTFMYKP